MNTRIALIAATALGTLAVPAQAQSYGDDPFTGPRVEGVVGVDILTPGSSEDFDNNDDLDDSIEGVAYGVGVGYDFALGSTVVGIEGEYVESEAETDFDTTTFSGFGVGNIEAGRDLYVGARVGFRAGDNALVYAKGGYTNTRVNLLATDNTTDVGNDVELDGFRLGAGAEYALDSGVFIKGEYRYSNYSDATLENRGGVDLRDYDVDLDRHQVMVGVGYRF